LKDQRIKQSLQNFEKALTQLKTAVEKNSLTELERSGAIQNFEYCYELCWKTLKKMAEGEGRSAPTPRKAFQYALEAGLIQNEKIWVEMILDRNLTTHTYDEKIAEKVYQNIREKYYSALELIFKTLPH